MRIAILLTLFTVSAVLIWNCASSSTTAAEACQASATPPARPSTGLTVDFDEPVLLAEAPLQRPAPSVLQERAPVAPVARELPSYAAVLPLPPVLRPDLYSGAEVVVPMGLLLDAASADEELASWHSGHSMAALVRVSAQLDAYHTAATARVLALGQDDAGLDEYKSRADAIAHETEWIQTTLETAQKEPYSRTLPARTGEDDDDFLLQYESFNKEGLAVAAWDVQHAFKSELQRLAKVRFDNGDFDERLRPQTLG